MPGHGRQTGAARHYARAATKIAGGASTIEGARGEKGARYLEILEREYDGSTPTTELKMDHTYNGTTAAIPTSANISVFEEMVAKIKVKTWRGHTLVWQSELGAWVEGAVGKALSEAEFEEQMLKYAKRVVTAVGSKVRCWDVLNERIAESGTPRLLRHDVYYERFGKNDKYEEASKLVKFYVALWKEVEASKPAGVELFINEFACDRVSQYAAEGKGDGLKKLVKLLKELGCKVDGVGLQGHLNTEFFPSEVECKEIVEKWQTEFGASFKVAITEFELKLEGTHTTLQNQKESAEAVFKGYLAAGVSDFTIWGVYDGETDQLEASTLTTGPRPLPYDVEYKKKPFREVIDQFREQTTAKQTVLPGVDVNSTTGEVDWERASLAGAKVGRMEAVTEEEQGKTLAQNAKWAAKFGMRVCWIIPPTAAGAKAQREKYEALNASEKNAVIAFDFGNENWPGGAGKGELANGKEYGARYIAAAKEYREHSIPVPLLMQVRLAPDVKESWMKELGENSHAALKEALEPTAVLPTGNWLSSHPYAGKMTSAQVEPNNLGSSETAYRDGETNWGSQRFMKEIKYVKNLTGLNVPCAITEMGNSAWPGVAQSVGVAGNETLSWEHVAERIKMDFEAMKKVEEGTMPSPPSEVEVKVPFFIYYDLYAWNPKGEESFGILESLAGPGVGKTIGAPNEVGSTYKRYQEGAKAL